MSSGVIFGNGGADSLFVNSSLLGGASIIGGADDDTEDADSISVGTITKGYISGNGSNDTIQVGNVVNTATILVVVALTPSVSMLLLPRPRFLATLVTTR